MSEKKRRRNKYNVYSSDEEHDSEQSRIKYRIEIALPTVKSRFGHGSVRLSFGSCLCELDDT